MLHLTLGHLVRSSRGTNLIELAIVTPVLLLMLAGIADIGRSFQTHIVITNAAREGVRAATRLPCYPKDAAQRAVYRAKIIEVVQTAVTGNRVTVNGADITISPDPASGCAATGAMMRVTVENRLPTIVGSLVGVDPMVLRSSMALARLGNDQSP
jgi:Flp pilus assembly protein TadG